MNLLPELAALGVLVLAGVAEWLHARRVRRLAALAFGPGNEARPWTRGAGPARALALALFTWGCLTLFLLQPRTVKPAEVPEGGWRHLVILLDVSPSMQLTDAGPNGQQTRARRAGEILMSILNRIALEQCRVSVIAFYNGAKPVVIDTADPEVVRNILVDLPLDQAFTPGKTRLLDGLQEAVKVAKDWRPGSTTLVVASDGDSVPDTGMPALPPSIAQVLVIGVGDARLGRFIDGHQSRQDASTLRQVANRLRGEYHDGNDRHLPSPSLRQLSALLPMRDQQPAGRRELALAAVGLGGTLIGLGPVALALAGSRWPRERRASSARPPGTGA
ncbi:MAG: hypothetical protein RJA22_873 [Verrucomicrobiota bacterium]|jgi:Ca-activated chloride channel family protein